MQDDFDQCQRIIHDKFSSDICNDDFRNSLMALLERKSSITQCLLDRLEREIEASRDSIDSIWKTVTTLLKRHLLPQNAGKLFPINFSSEGILTNELNKSENPFCENPFANNKDDGIKGPFFLKCPYEDLQKFCRKPFTVFFNGKEFSYELVPQYGLVEQEKLLAYVARLYGIRVPLVFSPWARRAVDIRILEPVDVSLLDGSEKREILAMISEKFDGNLLVDAVVAWNLSISEPSNEQSRAFQSPLHDIVIYTHFFDDNITKTTYVIPEVFNTEELSQITAVRDEKSIRLCSRQELPENHRQIKLIPPSKLEYDMFTNFNSSKGYDALLNKERLRTEGDVHCVLSEFDLDWVHCKFDGIGKPGVDQKIVTAYQVAHRYANPIEDSLYTNLRNRHICRIRFNTVKSEGTINNFFTDYANYILDYMNIRYPEFRWIGVL